MSMTHEVFNQATPLADVNLFERQPAAAARRWPGTTPGYDRARFDALGAEAGSAEMQEHARLANLHSPSCMRTTASATASTRSSSTRATTR